MARTVCPLDKQCQTEAEVAPHRAANALSRNELTYMIIVMAGVVAGMNARGQQQCPEAELEWPEVIKVNHMWDKCKCQAWGAS